MDAGVRALTAYLDETWDALLKAVAGVDEAVLHWSPGAEVNSVAVLLRHLGGSERWWIGGAIGGAPRRPVRDKEILHDRPPREGRLRPGRRAPRPARPGLTLLAH